MPPRLQYPLIRETAAWFLVVTDLAFFYLVADFVGGGLQLTFVSPMCSSIGVQEPPRLWQLVMKALVV